MGGVPGGGARVPGGLRGVPGDQGGALQGSDQPWELPWIYPITHPITADAPAQPELRLRSPLASLPESSVGGLSPPPFWHLEPYGRFSPAARRRRGARDDCSGLLLLPGVPGTCTVPVHLCRGTPPLVPIPGTPPSPSTRARSILFREPGSPAAMRRAELSTPIRRRASLSPCASLSRPPSPARHDAVQHFRNK